MSAPIIRAGLRVERTFVVEARNTIDFAPGLMPSILSTPQLIGWLERTSREGLAPLLPEGHTTVGLEVELKHLAPAGLGQTVVCHARVLGVEGPKVAFQVEAYQASRLIARGFHRRHIVEMKRFSAFVERQVS